MLSFIGFAAGTAIVLLTYPPTLFDDGLSDVTFEVEPSVKPTPSVSDEPTPSVSASSTAAPEATVKATVTPSVSPTPSVSASSTAAPEATVKATVTPSVSPTAVNSTAPISTTKTLKVNPYSASKYGSVQVQIVVTDGVITSAKALMFPDADSRSSSISATSIPVLIKQTLEAKNSSDIQGATGASYTSAAWIDSLQSALAKM